MSTTDATTPAQTGVAAQERPRMSYEAWLAWEHEGSLSEWVNGEVIIMSPPTLTHQLILGFLSNLLGLYLAVVKVGQALPAPVGMRIDSSFSVREPDILFVRNERLHHFRKRHLDGPADLIIEIISDESVTRDRIDKFYEYQDGGVHEYWIIDPREGRQRVDVFVLDATGRYQPIPPEEGGIYRSVVIPGFWLREAWLWQEYPDTLSTLTEMIGAERLVDAIRSQQGS
jgi:Uma2 family endonuclease